MKAPKINNLKNIFNLLFILFSFSMNNLAQGSKSLKTSEENYSWKNNEWKLSSSYTYKYKRKNKLKSSIGNSLNYKDSIDKDKFISYKYGRNDSIREIINKVWSETTKSYYINDHYTFTYDSKSNLIIHSHAYWRDNEKPIKDSFEINDRIVNHYDSNDKLISTFQQLGNGKNNIFFNEIRQFYEYDSYNRILTQTWLHRDDFEKDSMIYQKGFYTYDTANNLSIILWKATDDDSKKMVEIIKNSYKYDEKKNLIEELEMNYSDEWNSSKRINSYDQNSNLINSLFLTWDKDKQSFRNSQNTIKKYDVNNNLIEETVQIWNKEKSVFENSSLSKFYYKK